jgi:hypothetical protein
MGIISITLKPSQFQKHSRLKMFNTVALPALLYGCDSWAIREQGEYRIKLVEMRFTGRKAKHTWQDYITN